VAADALGVFGLRVDDEATDNSSNKRPKSVA